MDVASVSGVWSAFHEPPGITAATMQSGKAADTFGAVSIVPKLMATSSITIKVANILLFLFMFIPHIHYHGTSVTVMSTDQS